MHISLTNMVAVVNGSSAGIGKSIAIGLASLGASVVLVARSEKKLQSVLNELSTAQGQRHYYITADHDKVEDLIEKLKELIKQNDLSIGILINNSGGPGAGSLLDSDASALGNAMQRHLLCNHQLAQLCVPHMVAAQYGRIINVLSTSVKVPIRNLGVSNSTRAAVASWGKTLSNELAADGITVNNILPGFTDTGRLQSLFETWAEKQGVPLDQFKTKMEESVPAKRIGTPEEIANAVCFLASPAASYINGVSLRVDGGRTPSI